MLTFCRRSIEAGIVTCVLAAMLLSQTAVAQFAGVSVSEKPAKGSRTNLFASWEGTDRMDGMIVELPIGWSLESATILLDGYRAHPSRIQSLDARSYQVLVDEPLDSPAEIVFGLHVGESYAAERLEIIPLVRSGADLRRRPSLAITRTVRARDAAIDFENKVLSFEPEDAQPLTFRRDAVPDVQQRRPFSLSFWMKTVGLGEVVFSTWNGDDRSSYPVEMIIDRTGRLRSFRGMPGEHQSLGSEEPVADGLWHHIQLVNDPDQGWLRLIVDGDNVDSLYAAVPPDVRTQLPMVLGGRSESETPYFDGLGPFKGQIDEFEVSAIESNGAPGALLLGFEEDLRTDIFAHQPRGVRRVGSDRVVESDVSDVRVEHVIDGVVLNWRSSEPEIRQFIVERSADGQTFVEIERLQAAESGEYRVHDSGGESGVVYYRVRQIYSGGKERVSGTVKVGIGEEQPSSAAVLGNYPNPFNATTTITYEVRKTTDLQLAIWDLSGQPVQTLVDRTQNTGVYQARFDADGLPSGTYFVRLRTSDGVDSHKMILAK